jgi:hypothetical protein
VTASIWINGWPTSERTKSMQQIIDFILEMEKLKGVTRKTRPLGLEEARSKGLFGA